MTPRSGRRHILFFIRSSTSPAPGFYVFAPALERDKEKCEHFSARIPLYIIGIDHVRDF
jgi:hypothetical protein